MAWDRLIVAIEHSQKWVGFIPWLLLAVLVCLPFERRIPRIQLETVAARRTVVIACIALIGFFIMQVYVWWMQSSVINVFVKLKFFSLSKLPVPDWLLLIISFLILDLLYYLAHYVSHHVPLLWRLHKIHHSDEHVTAFSSLLHHPLESIFVALFIIGFAVMLGLPVLVYVYFGLALAFHAVFAHANIAISPALDRKLRWFVVTPDVHRTHHSQDLREGNSNLGAMFTIWDRLFGTYVDQPHLTSSYLRMGLPAESRPKAFTTSELLLFPFRKK